jgi:hypothetical protein
MEKIRNESSIIEMLRKPDAVKQTADGNIIYLGFAWPGTPSLDAPVWNIERITIDPDTGIMERMYPDGDKRQFLYRMSECEEYDYQFAR